VLECISSGRRLGKPSSIHETKSRAMSKLHRLGGPKSLNTSFYCPDWHPEHPYNMRLNGPRSERSTRVFSTSSQVPTSQTPNHDKYNGNRETEAGQRLEETHASQVMESPNNNEPSMVTNLAQNITPRGESQTLVPVNTITRRESGAEATTGQYGPLFQQGGAADGFPFSRGFRNSTPEPGVISTHTSPLADTQGTRNSTQLSNVFSQPAEVAHSTPPTQESPEDPVAQMNTSHPNHGVGSNDAEMTDASQDPLGSTGRAPALGKRRRSVFDISGETPRPKRTLFRERRDISGDTPKAKPRLYKHRPLFRKKR
jgi:hypothetical protein